MLEEKFKVIRNEQEHENNELHKICRYYEWLLENGVPKEDARKYTKWMMYQMEKK